MVGPPRPPFPSAPSEPSLRRLGTGRSANNDRPIRAQLVVALVALIILLAVPLYLWRRPSTHLGGSDAGAPAPSTSISLPSILPSVAQPVALQPEPIRTSPLQRVRCGSSRTRATNSVACDALPALEHSFVEAIQKTAECAPRTSKEGSINFVLEVDFGRKTLHVFPGKSGDWRGPSARRTTKCVEKAIAKPDFASMTHNYSYYALAVMATYPQPGATSIAVPVSTTLVPAAPVLQGAATSIQSSTETGSLPVAPGVH